MTQSKKRGHSPEEERERKRQMLLDNRINFEGPINPIHWPQCHSALFSAIREIEYIRYNEYKKQIESIHPQSSQRSRTMNKVDNLVSAAMQCRTEGTNEDTWRDKTENHLLSIFSNAMEW